MPDTVNPIHFQFQFVFRYDFTNLLKINLAVLYFMACRTLCNIFCFITCNIFHH